MMIREALQYLTELCDIRTYEMVESHEDKSIWVHRGSGAMLDVPRPRKKFDWLLGDIPSLVEFAFSHGGDPSLLVSLTGVLAILDMDSNRRESRALCKVEPSKLFRLLDRMEGEPKNLVRFLKLHFRDADIVPGDLIERLSHVRFERASDQEHVVQHGDESMKTSHIEKVSGKSPIPQEASFEFDPYPGIDHKGAINNVTVECMVFPDAANNSITITPLLGQVEQAQLSALRDLQALVKTQCWAYAVDVTVWLGETDNT